MAWVILPVQCSWVRSAGGRMEVHEGAGRGLGSGGARRARRAGIAFLAVVMCVLVLLARGDSRGGGAAFLLGKAVGAAAPAVGGGIIAQARSEADKLRHTLPADDGEKDAELVPHLSDKDLLAIAVREQHTEGVRHSPGHKAEKEAIDEDHGHIPSSLLKLAKQAKELQGSDPHSRSNSPAARESHQAEDMDHGRVPQKILQETIAAATEMRKEGDVAGSGAQRKGSRKYAEEAVDKDRGVVSDGLKKLAQQAIDERHRGGNQEEREGQHQAEEPHLKAGGDGALAILRLAEAERQADLKLAHPQTLSQRPLDGGGR